MAATAQIGIGLVSFAHPHQRPWADAFAEREGGAGWWRCGTRMPTVPAAKRHAWVLEAHREPV